MWMETLILTCYLAQGTRYLAQGGNTFFFRNTGSGTNPVFTEQTGVNNPFDGITGTTSKYGIQEAIPVFVDIDGDSDKDLFIGSSYTSDYFGPHDAVKFYENTSGNFALASHYLTSYLANFNSETARVRYTQLSHELVRIVVAARTTAPQNIDKLFEPAQKLFATLNDDCVRTAHR